MNTKGIPPIHRPERLVEIAFRRASKEARKVQIRNRKLRKKRAEERRVKEASNDISTYLRRVEGIEARIEDAQPFYRELLEAAYDMEKIIESIKGLSWARKTILRLEEKARREIRMSKGDPVILRKDFYGKTASILDKTKPKLEFLGAVIETLKDFPTVLEGFTVVIAGMPNVGKSSLLRELTTSKPEIRPYPFTTKNILIGYILEGHRRIQVIDTPGLLDRPLEDRNPVERKSILALKHLADLIIFLFDPTEGCGYPMDSQLELYYEVRGGFPSVIPVINKIDISSESRVQNAKKKIGEGVLLCSAKMGGVDDVRKQVVQLSRKRE